MLLCIHAILQGLAKISGVSKHSVSCVRHMDCLLTAWMYQVAADHLDVHLVLQDPSGGQHSIAEAAGGLRAPQSSVDTRMLDLASAFVGGVHVATNLSALP